MNTSALVIHIAGSQASYACAAGDTLLRAGLRAGIGQIGRAHV